MNGQVVLSLFPGADLFGRAFEERGFCVVRGPDKILGQDIKDFHVPPGRFDGVIGGPPCQAYSQAAITGSTAEDLIPEFVRVCREAAPLWIVMENLRTARNCPEIPPEWNAVKLRDWDCGGKTARTRLFWAWPYTLACSILSPPRLGGKPAYSVLCASHKRGLGKKNEKRGNGRSRYKRIEEAAALQGFPELGAELEARRKKKDNDMNRTLAMKLLGNGVPRAMGLWVASSVQSWLERSAEK